MVGAREFFCVVFCCCNFRFGVDVGAAAVGVCGSGGSGGGGGCGTGRVTMVGKQILVMLLSAFVSLG